MRELPLWQLHQNLLIESELHILNNPVFLETLDRTCCRCIAAAETVHELLRLKLVREFSIALVVAGCPAAHHELLVLIGEVVVGHLAEEEVLALVLDFHRQAAEPFVGVIHRQRLRLLPFIPVAHQNERKRHTDTIIRYAFQEQAVGLVVIEVSNLQMTRLPVEGLVIEGLEEEADKPRS